MMKLPASGQYGRATNWLLLYTFSPSLSRPPTFCGFHRRSAKAPRHRPAICGHALEYSEGRPAVPLIGHTTAPSPQILPDASFPPFARRPDWTRQTERSRIPNGIGVSIPSGSVGRMQGGHPFSRFPPPGAPNVGPLPPRQSAGMRPRTIVDADSQPGERR